MITTLDGTVLAKIESRTDMDRFIESLDLKSDTVLIKPNWVDRDPGTFTEAEVLDLFLTSLKGKKVYFIESYTFWRNQKFARTQQDSFSSQEALMETGKVHWDFFKQADEWFLKDTGLDRILKKHNAEFINITDKLWQENQDPLPLVPQAVLNLKGSDLISFSKLKGDGDYGATLSIKNMFGLYPDPHRMKKFHGDNDSLLENSILEINEIYRSLFNCYYVVEGIYVASSVDWGDQGVELVNNTGLIIGGQDAVQVDHTALKIINRQFLGPLTNLLSDYQSRFGGSLQSREIPTDYLINFPKI